MTDQAGINKQEVFKSVIASLAEIYDKKLSSIGRQLWWSTLKPYTAEQIGSAMQAHLSDPDRGRFAPKPADLIAKIDGEGRERDALAHDLAIRQWDLAMQAIGRDGRFAKVKLDEAGQLSLNILGGIRAICGANSTEIQWLRKEFINHYKQIGAADLASSRIKAIESGDRQGMQDSVKIDYRPKIIKEA